MSVVYDGRGRAHRLMSADEVHELALEERRELLRGDLRGLRTELAGLPQRWAAVDARNRHGRLTNPDHRDEVCTSAAEIEAEIRRVEALIAAV